ncbi:MAG TPA: MerR family transcriptional regulator [Acidimicrobiales bacterium]|nr:MerR family transcriptional regulator [Acidimicrobiales bacterium]
MTVTELPRASAPPAPVDAATPCGPPAPVLPQDGPLWLSIAEVAEQTGVSAHTLRYYERIGLLEVPRDHAGRRRYTNVELARLVFITRLRLTAMPIRDIQAYFRLVDEGPGNESERLALLERHRNQVKIRLTALQAALDVIDFKIATYGGVCEPTP